MNPEALFYVTGTWKALGNCAGALPVSNIVKVVLNFENNISFKFLFNAGIPYYALR